MSGNPFYLLDVFAENKYSGNQLAVIRVRNPLSDNDMQRIAREINFSETTFILSETPRDGGYDVRIFTPGEEVPFAGHPTLGTAYVIRNEIARDTVDRIVLNLKVGQIPVTFGKDGIAWMKQLEPVFGKTLDRATLAPVLGLKLDEIDARFPIEEVSTGLPHILVPLRSLESLKRARVDRDLYFDLIKNTWAKPIMIFCPEPHEKKNDLSVRMFADAFGIPEDPATGSGNGCLAGYLVKHRYFGKPEIDIRSEQGYEIGRPSLLYLRADETDGKTHVSVGGKSVMIAKGDFV
ncbi:MAG TPA: PhzF family phenazine biosynthesis protein [Nitrospirota bacterium]|nr:PhzF family phenazine biosynthesis protein [Nitrospirota bacterium]